MATDRVNLNVGDVSVTVSQQATNLLTKVSRTAVAAMPLSFLRPPPPPPPSPHARFPLRSLLDVFLCVPSLLIVFLCVPSLTLYFGFPPSLLVVSLTRDVVPPARHHSGGRLAVSGFPDATFVQRRQSCRA